MTSLGVIISLVILFVLIVLLIVLSIIALVATNKTAKRKSPTIHEFMGPGTDETFELLKPAYFYYNITSDSKLTLSGKRGIFVTINNDSNNDIILVPNPNVPSIEGTRFTMKKNYLNKDGSYTLSGGKIVTVIWKEDNIGRIVRA